jgi:hypothetical protein
MNWRGDAETIVNGGAGIFVAVETLQRTIEIGVQVSR